MHYYDLKLSIKSVFLKQCFWKKRVNAGLRGKQT